MKMNNVSLISLSEVKTVSDVTIKLYWGNHNIEFLMSPNHQSLPVLKNIKIYSQNNRKPSQLTYPKVNSTSQPVKSFYLWHQQNFFPLFSSEEKTNFSLKAAKGSHNNLIKLKFTRLSHASNSNFHEKHFH